MDTKQKKLLRILDNLHPDLGAMYESGISILNNNGIKDRIRITAYCLRELLNHIPQYKDNTLIKNPHKLGTLIKPVLEMWENLRISDFINVTFDITWLNEQQSSIHTFLLQFETFYAKNKEIHKSRREKAIQFVRIVNTDYSIEGLPEHQEEIIGSLHIHFSNYFNKVAHAKIGLINEEEFYRKLSELEYFLTNLLEPDVSFINSELDKIIEAGEKDAN